MGFTIGGLREMRPGARRRSRSWECAVVAECTALWGWSVVPGARAVQGACSCGRGGCPAPGAHPLPFAPVLAAGTRLDEVGRVWGAFPGASALLVVGEAFDVIEVGESAGLQALARLERMAVPLGPVVRTPDGRAQFFVAPGTAAALPGLLYRMGWDGAGLDLRGLGAGEHVTVPPFDRGGRGAARWLRAPGLDCASRAPQARLVLGTLAYMAHRAPAGTPALRAGRR
jgi:hypothetical protein